MAKLQEYNLRKVLLLHLLFVFSTSTLFSATHSRSTRKLLELRNYDTAPIINKNITFAPNFSTKIIKTTTSISIDNSSAPTTIKAQPQKPNSKPKKKEVVSHDTIVPMLRTPRFFEKRPEEEDEEDLVAELRELTSKFQETFIPDMERISQTSKTYIQKYNKEFTNGYFGPKYALIFIIIPLILLSLILAKLRPSFSLLRILLLIHLSLLILRHSLSILSPHRPRAARPLLRGFSLCLRVRPRHADAGLRVVPPASAGVPGSCFLGRGWAGCQDAGPGPDARGLCGWAALVCECVASGRAGSAAEGGLGGACGVRHVFRCDWCVGEGWGEEEGLFGRGW